MNAHYLAVCVDAVKKAAKHIASSQSHRLQQNKQAGSYSIQEDKESEQIIINHITQQLGEQKIISEETQDSQTLSGLTFIIDPIDGTYNYSRGFHDFALSVGIAQDGKSIGGVVFMPQYNELYTAWQHHGAFCNNKPLTFNPQFPKPLIGIDGPSKQFLHGLLDTINDQERWKKMMSQVCTQMHTAHSRLEGACIVHPFAWDIAAGIAIMQEAGCLVVDQKGKEPTVTSKYILAGTPQIVEELQQIVKKY